MPKEAKARNVLVAYADSGYEAKGYLLSHPALNTETRPSAAPEWVSVLEDLV